ncbi:MAG: hypothetical protein V7706_01885 [Dietzia psychralcaliphila]
MSSTHTPTTGADPFAVVRKGFDREQVTSSLTRLEAEAELLRADRDAAVERAERAATEAARERARAASLEARVAELGRTPVTSEQMSDRLSTMLALATAEAESIRDSALAAADRVRSDAEEEAWNLREAARREAAADREAATAELTAARLRAAAVRTDQAGVLDAARSRAEEIIKAAEREARRLDLEAAHRRDLIDEDHRIASDARRTESRRQHEDRQAASVAEAEAVKRDAQNHARETIDQATAEAASLIARARRHTEELQTVRERILADLASIRARLEPIPGRPDDPALPADPGLS